MTQYYFVATSLPPLELGVPPEISFRDFQILLKDNLKPKDLAKADVIRLYYDIQNIRFFLKNEPLDFRGSLSESELEEELLTQEYFPEYVFDYLGKYDTKEKKLQNFPELLSLFFRKETLHDSAFLRNYLKFEHDLKVVMTALRAKTLKKDILQELQFEDPNDPLVAEVIAQKDAKTFIAPNGYQELQALYEEHIDKPEEFYQALVAYRFHKVEDMLGIDMFSIDRILGYMVQLISLEQWLELDKQKGKTIIDSVIKG